jgi:hypothetical protein
VKSPAGVIAANASWSLRLLALGINIKAIFVAELCIASICARSFAQKITTKNVEHQIAKGLVDKAVATILVAAVAQSPVNRVWSHVLGSVSTTSVMFHVDR